MVIVVMGPTGSGKTTIGSLLAQQLGWDFVDADQFHSAANKEKMHQGIPLTDADRAPWLAAIHQQIEQWIAEKRNVVRSEEHTSELQSLTNLVCRLLLEKKT